MQSNTVSSLVDRMMMLYDLHQNIVIEVLHHHPFYIQLHLYHQIYTNENLPKKNLNYLCTFLKKKKKKHEYQRIEKLFTFVV